MTKSKYYVSVQSKSLLREQGSAAYEWEIEATDEEAEALAQLLKHLDESENTTFPRGMTPGVPYHWDHENDAYDGKLRQIYSTIRRLGTPETKAHIAGMIDQLSDIGSEYLSSNKEESADNQ